jgi:hypothetical protein
MSKTLSAAPPRTRRLTILAQDPAVRDTHGGVLRAHVEIPAEAVAAGPWGHRVQIIDFDASTGVLYAPRDAGYGDIAQGSYVDPYENATDAELLRDPQFHAQNVYAIAMRTLAYFEKACGRRISWGFGGHQLKVAPHAFADANAFYSAQDEALVFGYFPDIQSRRSGQPKGSGMVFSCLSHDVVAHECTHALIDGLRHRFIDPSSPDQAAFHEGFADVVALLSIFSLPDIVNVLLDFDLARDRVVQRDGVAHATVAREKLTAQALRDSALLGLAEEMGSALSGIRGHPLRCAGELSPSKEYLEQEEFEEPHRRGEILLAVMINTFLEMWIARIGQVREVSAGQLERDRVVEEGVVAADYLLLMAIRALDYTPPVDLQFGDFLSAMITADWELRPDDSEYNLRNLLLASFDAYGISPASLGANDRPGCWTAGTSGSLNYDRTHFEPMLRDADEVFAFIWENREALGVFEGAWGRVISVRPSLRIAPDGFPLRETVIEFIQEIELAASELKDVRDHKSSKTQMGGIERPSGLSEGQMVRLYGGNTLIFDEYGRLKYNIHNGITDDKRQTARIAYLWRAGYFTPHVDSFSNFASMHVRRALDLRVLDDRSEEW